nr:MAG TPA: hypothetical protein [Caudoviricetes sp.]
MCSSFVSIALITLAQPFPLYVPVCLLLSVLYTVTLRM